MIKKKNVLVDTEARFKSSPPKGNNATKTRLSEKIRKGQHYIGERTLTEQE